jgi:hypothetical protein
VRLKISANAFFVLFGALALGALGAMEDYGMNSEEAASQILESSVFGGLAGFAVAVFAHRPRPLSQRLRGWINTLWSFVAAVFLAAGAWEYVRLGSSYHWLWGGEILVMRILDPLLFGVVTAAQAAILLFAATAVWLTRLAKPN